MNFEKVLQILSHEFNNHKIDFALIGGLALNFSGISRSTFDIDLLIKLSDSEKVHNIMERLNYKCLYRTENVANYESTVNELGRVDFLYAHRKYTQNMLKQAKKKKAIDKTVKVIRIEDLIGLKVQSSSNDPDRYHQDMSDIENLIRENIKKIDLKLVKEYFKLFDREKELNIILKRYQK